MTTGTHRWDADRELTPETVRAVVAALHPELAGAPVEPVGHGWDVDVFRARHMVFAFPRRATVGASLQTELAEARLAVQLQIADLLAPFGVAVPVHRVSQPEGLFPYPVTTYPWIPGRALDRGPVGPGVARHLGEIFTMLHSGPGPAARALPVETDTAAEWLDEARALGPELPPLLGPLAGQVRAWLTSDVEAPTAYAGPLRFIHDDMCPDHVLLDEAGGAVVGILDWSDAAWGDPALDFVTMRAAMGSTFADAMVRAYMLPVDAGFRTRIDFMARVESLKWLHHAHLRGGDLDKHRRWVERAFAG